MYRDGHSTFSQMNTRTEYSFFTRLLLFIYFSLCQLSGNLSSHGCNFFSESFISYLVHSVFLECKIIKFKCWCDWCCSLAKIICCPFWGYVAVESWSYKCDLLPRYVLRWFRVQHLSTVLLCIEQHKFWENVRWNEMEFFTNHSSRWKFNVHCNPLGTSETSAYNHPSWFV